MIVGVDPSLTSTGLAWLCTDDGEWITSRVRTGAQRSVAGQSARIASIARQVRAFARDAGEAVPDLVVIEGLSHGSHGSATRDLAGLWWRVVEELLAVGCPLLVIAPATRAKYAAGSGRASKSDVLSLVRETYPDADVPGHDVADAVALAALGARVKGLPAEASPWSWQEEVAAQVVRREQEKEQG